MVSQLALCEDAVRRPDAAVSRAWDSQLVVVERRLHAVETAGAAVHSQLAQRMAVFEAVLVVRARTVRRRGR